LSNLPDREFDLRFEKNQIDPQEVGQ
jgi:hypothetical protein